MTDASQTPDIDDRARKVVAERRDDPEFVEKYDRDGDGELDDEEMREAQRAVALEMRTRRRDSEEGAGEVDLAGEVLRDRFQVLESVGRGGQGVTWLAEDGETGERAAVKQLDVEAVDDWKEVERFEREVEALERIDHPAVPTHFDAFRESYGGRQHQFLAREYVEGRDLDDRIRDGEPYSEEDVRQLAVELLDVLEHIHALEPPIVHRDAKPSNVIIGDSGAISLVDFGAVHEVVADEEGGSTMVGTSGYMPVEQMMGRAVPATDLYALGATLVRVLTRRELVDLPVERMRLQYHSYVDIDDEFREFLDRLLAPYPEDRFDSAQAARDFLEGESNEDSGGSASNFEEAPKEEILDPPDEAEATEFEEAPEAGCRPEPGGFWGPKQAVMKFDKGRRILRPHDANFDVERSESKLEFEVPTMRSSDQWKWQGAAVVWAAVMVGGLFLTFGSAVSATGQNSFLGFGGGIAFLAGLVYGTKWLWRFGNRVSGVLSTIRVTKEAITVDRASGDGSPTGTLRLTGEPDADLQTSNRGQTWLRRQWDSQRQWNWRGPYWRVVVFSDDGRLDLKVGPEVTPPERVWIAYEIDDFLADQRPEFDDIDAW